mgnify:CR=1 FL=1
MKPILLSSLSLSCTLLLSVTGCSSSNVFAPTPKSAMTKPAPTSAAAAAATSAAAPMLPAAAPAPGPGSGRITTTSGLQYEVISSGPAGGRHPTRNDSVVVHYHGTLPSGTVFDSSIERGMPATFGVGQVIPGWTEALQLMKPGDKWNLYIPYKLAYGDRAMGDKIPPFSDLNFQVELLQILGGE